MDCSELMSYKEFIGEFIISNRFLVSWAECKSRLELETQNNLMDCISIEVFLLIIQSDVLDIFLSSYEDSLDCNESKFSYKFLKYISGIMGKILEKIRSRYVLKLI